MEHYNPFDWFWIVGGDDALAWSSAAGQYVADWPSDRQTRISSEAELSAVLKPYGLLGPSVSSDDFADAIEAHVDAAAKSRNYASAVSLASYVQSTNAQWAAEAQAFVAWRDAAWGYAYGELAKVQAGQRAIPSVAEMISELPAIAWPS